MRTTRFVTAFWALARPYWVSEQRSKGLALLVAVIGLALALVWINVQLNQWNNDFYNALQERQRDDFYRMLGKFTVLAFAYIGIAVYRFYLQQMLQIEWRTWLNERFLADWLKDRAYYRLQLLDRGTDNPDQRIAEDLNLFVSITLSLGLGLLSAVVTLGGRGTCGRERATERQARNGEPRCCAPPHQCARAVADDSCARRQAAGGMPTRRLKARANAASES